MNTTYVATAGLETAPLQDGSVLYNLKTGKFILLNRSAAFLWAELSTPVTADVLLRRLHTSFTGSASEAVRTDLNQALARFIELELASGKDGMDGVPAQADRADAAGTEPIVYASPEIRVLDEEELLNIFQMTAAEISVASCWWSACATPGCP